MSKLTLKDNTISSCLYVADPATKCETEILLYM